ncbi:MAG: hypothetical protein Q9M91_07045 [Candidatus Dojkabacteria bacterium]|nr:hypothetical protein [Candidatus Dojkabacteria bacterium]MDQ7021548.1 hypothetical protein [Candidatus Dojkabacteria bacterium]
MQTKTYQLTNEAGLEVTFRDIRIEEAPILASWMRSTEGTQFLGQGAFCQSQESEVEWIQKKYKSTDSIMIGVESEGNLVGTWGAHEEHYARWGTGSMLGNKEVRGKGIGSLAHMFRTWYLFTQVPMPIFCLESTVLWDNNLKIQNWGSYKALYKSRYRNVGYSQQKYHFDGKWIDCMHLECHNPKFVDVNRLPEELKEGVEITIQILNWVSERIERV